MLTHVSSFPGKLPRVVVLGAQGFIGGALIRGLRRGGTSCLPVDRPDLDLLEPASLKTLQSILATEDALVVASALTPEHGRDRSTFLKNVTMIHNLCTVLEGFRVRHVIYLSSDSVYDARCARVSEESPCETEDPYGLSHIVREKFLQMACRKAGIPLAILRAGAVYGPGDTHDSYGPNRFLRSALRENKISLFGGGEEKRDHIFIDDVVRLIELCLLHGSAGVLNVVTGHSATFAEAAQTVVEALPAGVKLDYLPRRVPVIHREFDAAALKSAFPAFQPTPLEGGIRATIERSSAL